MTYEADEEASPLEVVPVVKETVHTDEIFVPDFARMATVTEKTMPIVNETEDLQRSFTANMSNSDFKSCLSEE